MPADGLGHLEPSPSVHLLRVQILRHDTRFQSRSIRIKAAMMP
jgi:hypothetical protein